MPAPSQRAPADSRSDAPPSTIPVLTGCLTCCYLPDLLLQINAGIVKGLIEACGKHCPGVRQLTGFVSSVRSNAGEPRLLGHPPPAGTMPAAMPMCHSATDLATLFRHA